MTALHLYDAGYTPLVSVMPPLAALSPNSSVRPEQRGKTPGQKTQAGTWAGYPWLTHEASRDDVKRWVQAGANIGLKAARFPAVDIDSLDPWLSKEVAAIAQETLGSAPQRTGRAPKQLLMYRLKGDPFARLAVIVTLADGSEHLVEVLGAGRQYLVEGDHPSGVPYRWDRAIPHAQSLTEVSLTDIIRFFAVLADRLEVLPGVRVDRIGTGAIGSDRPQADLLAPSIAALRECVGRIPNDNEVFPSRDSYIKMGEAIHAAAGDSVEDGFEIFAGWAARWLGNDRYPGNEPETVRSDWRRIHGPHRVGWGWLADLAKRFGFNAAQHEFDVPALLDTVREKAEEDQRAPQHSDLWLAERVIEDHGGQIRFVPMTGKWFCWNRGRWQPDALMLVDHIIAMVMKREAALVLRQGVTPAEQKASKALADRLCSTHRVGEVRTKLKSDPRIATTPDAFDADPWVLNTPAGIIDLKTGALGAHDMDRLCARQTGVAPDAEMPAPVWFKFLDEITEGSAELAAYLQRFCGYALTGATSEEVLEFIWGTGKNGKSKFVGAITEILKDYHELAAMDTFTASTYDKHPTDLASLAGARLVTAIETQDGRRWDEQRIKTITGGDPVKARFMRQDFFTFTPQFKLLIIGNYRPEMRGVDEAMRRRLHMIPFTFVPPVKDQRLAEKLRKEYPRILSWMIEGCLKWQTEGLQPPAIVRAATDEYFEDEDPVGRWLDERCDLDAAATATTTDLFRDWQEWANARGEYVGTMKRLAQIIAVKRFPKWREAGSRRMGFRGLTLRVDIGLEALI